MSRTADQIKEEIERQWNKKAHSKTEWLVFESIIKDTLSLVKFSNLEPKQGLLLIDEALGAFLRRGQVFPCSD